LVLLWLPLDALILKRATVDASVVAVAFKMAVRQLLPCVPQPVDILAAVPVALLLLGLGAAKPFSSILRNVTSTCA
jgi:hypothetical protein